MLFKKKKVMRKYLIVLSVLIALTISGCATDTKQKKLWASARQNR
jgi:hypothetical protein